MKNLIILLVLAACTMACSDTCNSNPDVKEEVVNGVVIKKWKMDGSWTYVTEITYPNCDVSIVHYNAGTLVFSAVLVFLKFAMWAFFVYVGIVVIKRLKK
jgi:predicted small secreted protein